MTLATLKFVSSDHIWPLCSRLVGLAPRSIAGDRWSTKKIYVVVVASRNPQAMWWIALKSSRLPFQVPCTAQEVCSTLKVVDAVWSIRWSYVCFLRHGGTPIAGWFISSKNHLEMDDTSNWGYPHDHICIYIYTNTFRESHPNFPRLGTQASCCTAIFPLFSLAWKQWEHWLQARYIVYTSKLTDWPWTFIMILMKCLLHSRSSFLK